MKKLILYIFSLFICWLSGRAQPPVKYSFKHYGVLQGLASNEVLTSLQDERGFIWIGTTNGLQQYDGSRFRTFRNEINNPASLPGNYITQLLRDKNKNMWVHASGDKIGIFDTRKFIYKDVIIRPSDPEHIRAGKGLVTDEEGNVLLLIATHELLTYNKKKNEFSAAHNFISSPPGWKIVGLYHLPGTQKYIMGAQEGIAIYNRKTNQLSYPGHNVENEKLIELFGNRKAAVSYLLDRKGRLWFDNWEKGMPAIYCFNMITNEVIYDEFFVWPMIKVYHELRGFVEQKNGTIWLKGLGIFAQYDENKKQFRNVYNGYENEQSIAYTKVNELSEDREGNIWVATNNNGLYRFNPAAQFFTNIRHTNRVNGKPGEGSPMSFAITNNQTMLAGTWGDGIYHYDKNFNLIPVNIKGYNETSMPSLWSMYVSKDSTTIWAGAQPGIHRIDQRSKTVQMYNPPILQNKTIRQVVEDNYSNLWIGTQSIGLYKWNAQKGKHRFDDGIEVIKDVPHYQVLKMCMDKKGNVWVATNGSGVYVIDPGTNKIIMHFGTKEPEERKLLFDGVASVLMYNDTTMLIAANGLHLFNTRNQKIEKVISLPESIPGTIAAMEKDRQGYVWISMTGGILRVNLKNKIFIHFDRVDGIGNDYFIVAASFSLPDGRLVFGADNQFVVFNPGEIKINNPAPDVTITGFKLMNKPLLVDSLLQQNQVELSPKDNSISIEFSSLMYAATYRMAYMLQGLDKDWVKADNTNTAVYSYLPPGSYTFLLKSFDAEGNASKGITKLLIRVKPPFWKTWWFLGLIIFAATAVIYWLDKLRMQKLRATESVRTRIATSLTEDMSSSLSNINISSELAKRKIDTDAQRAKEYIGQISETSNRMVQAMYDMVWSIDPKNDTMADTIDRMKNFAVEIENSFTINVEFDIDKQVNRLRLDMEHRYELLCIYKEALTNAARYSDGRYVKVSLRYYKAKLMMIIIDDGKGFLMTEAAMLGRGISDMHRRAAAINASFYIESEINTGTVLKVEMPVR